MASAKKAFLLLIIFYTAALSAINVLDMNLPTYDIAVKSHIIQVSSVNATPPIMKVYLSNGTILNISTVDKFLEYVYGGTLSIETITRIEVLPIEEYLSYITANETENRNLTYYDAKRLFYSRSDEPLENYTGTIIPVNETDYLAGSFGSDFTRGVMYGLMEHFYMNITQGNATTQIDLLQKEDRKPIVVLYYTRLNNQTYINNTIESIAKKFLEIKENIELLIVDTTNTYSGQNVLKVEDMDIYVVRDNLTRIDTANSSYYDLVLGNTTELLPLVVLVDSQEHLMWYKGTVRESLDETLTYIKMYLENKTASLPVYPILEVAPIEPTAGEPCKIVVSLGEGFGEIEKIELHYELLDENNKTLESPKSVYMSVDTLSYTIKQLLNETRYIRLQAKVTAEYGSYTSAEFVYKVKYTPEKPKPIPPIVYDILFGLALLLVLIGIGFTIYKKYFKE